MRERNQLWSLGVVAGLAVAGLGGASSGGCGGSSSDDAGYVDAGGYTLTCVGTTNPPVTAWAPGVTATSLDGQMKVTFTSATPAPPADDLDAFTVKITDGSGTPMENLPISVTPFMPQMFHGVGTTPAVDGGSGGVYDISDVYLFMAGIWSVTFKVNTDGGESAQIDFCIAG